MILKKITIFAQIIISEYQKDLLFYLICKVFAVFSIICCRRPVFRPGKVYFAVAVKNVGVHTIFQYNPQVGGSAGVLPEKPTSKRLTGEKMLNTCLNIPLKMMLKHKTVWIKGFSFSLLNTCIQSGRCEWYRAMKSLVFPKLSADTTFWKDR